MNLFYKKYSSFGFQLGKTHREWTHAFGDQYMATDFAVKGKGKLTITFTTNEGESQSYEVYHFQGMELPSLYNTDESIKNFAHASFNMALMKDGLYLSTKKICTIIKK